MWLGRVGRCFPPSSPSRTMLRARRGVRRGAMEVPSIEIGNGAHMPMLGLGTWKSKPGEVERAVEHAVVRAGYRHIEVYGNEEEIGNALQRVFEQGVERKDLFITSKVFNNYHGKDRVHLSLEKTLAALKLEYLDLFLMHWPISFEESERPTPCRLESGMPHPSLHISFEFLETWSALEELQRSGKVRNIGVCNFTKEQLETLLAASSIPPVVNQVEFHPFLYQKELLQFCRANGITVTAYSPLGSPDSYSGRKEGAPSLLRDPEVNRVAEEVGRSAAQVLIRWAIQHGMVVIPKSVTPSRIEQNIAVFDFSLTPVQMEQLNALDRSHRFGLGWMPGHFLPE